MNVLNDPRARVAGRALYVFAATLVAQLQASDHLDSTVLRSAIIGAGLALLEVFTPLNPTVGVGKPPPKG